MGVDVIPAQAGIQNGLKNLDSGSGMARFILSQPKGRNDDMVLTERY